MTDSLTLEQKKSRRGLLALVGAGGAAAVAALLGRSNGAEAAVYEWTSASYGATGLFENTVSGDGLQGTSNSGYGLNGSSYSGVGVYGHSNSGLGVFGWGKPGVHGVCTTNNGSGVRGDGQGPGTIGVLARNNPGRRALRTKGQVQMDCVRRKTLSSRSTKITLPTSTRAGTNAVIMATVQGNPGNDAYIWRAYRVDSTHIRIAFNKAPANPVTVAYWVVHTG